MPSRAGSSSGWWVLFLLLVLAGAIRTYRIGDPLGGYHAYNEAWYSIIARNYADGSLLEPRIYELGIDYRTPPLYSQLVYFAEPLTGDFATAGRAVSIVASLVAMLFVFLIGRFAWGPRSGLFAAALFGFAPVAVVVGRNAQTDMSYVAFLVATLYFTLRSRKSRQLRYAALAGACFAAAFFTKYFALLLPLTLLMFELLHGDRRHFDRRLGVAVAVFVALLAPYYLYHLATSFDAFFAQQVGGAVQATRFDPSWDTLLRISMNVFFGFSPVYCLIFGVAGVVAFFRGDDTLSLCSLGFVVYFALYFLNDNHSYYQLSQLPFIALVAGCASAAIPGRRLASLLLAGIVASGAIASILFLASAKYGWGVIEGIGERIEAESPRASIVLEQSLVDSNAPVLKYACPECRLVVKESLARNTERVDLDYERGVYVIRDDLRGSLSGYEVVKRDVICIHWLGTGYTIRRANRHFFGTSVVRETIPTGEFFGIGPCARSAVKAIRRLPEGAHLATRRGRLFEVGPGADGTGPRTRPLQ